MSWFDHGGSRIYYEVDGSGDAVLLLPGWAGSIAELSFLKDALTPSFRVIAADLPGSGKSEPQPRQYSPTYYDDDARSFLALLDELSTGPAHVAGFSDGGEEALLMAALQPDMVRSVVAWGAAGQVDVPHEMLDALYDVIDRPIEPMKGVSERLRARYGEANARAMTQSACTAWRAMMEQGGDISLSRAADITCPVLLITGEEDHFTPPALVSKLAGAIGGAESLEVPGVGHDVHVARPEWLAQTVVERLAG